MNIVLLAVTCVSLYVFVASQVQQQSPALYSLTVQREHESSRGRGVDLITLRCINATSGMMMRPQDVTFWLNRVSSNDPDFKDEEYVIVDNQRKGIVFQLRVEGYYSCGTQTNVANVEESERVPLIGERNCTFCVLNMQCNDIFICFPLIKLSMHAIINFSLTTPLYTCAHTHTHTHAHTHTDAIALQTNFESLETMRTYFVALGGTVQLCCPVKPRGLSNYYYGQWTRNGTTIIEIPAPSEDGVPATIINRSTTMDLDRETFTLTFRSVTRSQASDNYRCVLYNVNPANGNSQEFTDASFLDISLMVDGKALAKVCIILIIMTTGECMRQWILCLER